MKFFKELFGFSKTNRPAPASDVEGAKPATTRTPPADSNARADYCPAASTTYPLYSSDHPAADEIAEAERIADEIIAIKAAGSGTITSLNSGNAESLMAALNAAVSKCPNNADLLYARASLSYLLLQAEDGKKVREQALAVNKDHLDAKMKGEHFKSWETIFNFPGWNESKTELPDVMAMHLALDHTVQVVRDHLKLALAIVVPESNIKLQGCHNLRWDLKWVATPHGKTAAHYLLLDNGQFAEFFMPHIVGQEANIANGYWLLRRLANEAHCFVVITRGRQVIRNERYKFPETLKETLRNMGAELEKEGPASNMAASQAASQWYMNNSDVSQIHF